jgi:hypothetical protein
MSIVELVNNVFEFGDCHFPWGGMELLAKETI